MCSGEVCLAGLYLLHKDGFVGAGSVLKSGGAWQPCLFMGLVAVVVRVAEQQIRAEG